MEILSKKTSTYNEVCLDGVIRGGMSIETKISLTKEESAELNRDLEKMKLKYNGKK